MKISVIVPYYEAEQWLGRCINSLIQQNGDFEFLFVNDKSIDDGPELVDSVALYDSRFISLDNEHCVGVSGARNTGIDHATGEWISFLDADDELTPEAWRAYEKASYCTENIFQFNHLRHYDKNGKTVSKRKYRNQEGLYFLDELPSLWEYVTNKLYRRSFIGSLRFDERILFGEDELFNMGCLAKDPRMRCFEQENFIHNFSNPNSLSKIKDEKALLNQVHILEEFLLQQDDSKIRSFVCDRISFLWSTKSFKRIIGRSQADV